MDERVIFYSFKTPNGDVYMGIVTCERDTEETEIVAAVSKEVQSYGNELVMVAEFFMNICNMMYPEYPDKLAFGCLEKVLEELEGVKTL